MKTRPIGFLFILLTLLAVWIGARSSFFKHKENEPEKKFESANPSGGGSKPQKSLTNEPEKKASASSGRMQSPQVARDYDPDKAEEKITQLLSDDKIPVLESSKVLISIALDSRVSLETRKEALSHGLNLIEDNDYNEIVAPHIKGMLNGDAEMQDLLFSDVYNREDEEKIPAALLMLESNQADIVTEAKELLSFLLDKDEEEVKSNAEWSKLATDYLAKKKVEDSESSEPPTESEDK